MTPRLGQSTSPYLWHDYGAHRYGVGFWVERTVHDDLVSEQPEPD